MIDIKDLEAFLAILDSGSISRAADQLGLTQPALSLKLKKMEVSLGVQLFQRTSRLMVPLDTCSAIEPLARDILVRVDALKEAVARSVAELEGDVRIACLVGWTEALLVPVIERMKEEYPRIRLRLHIMETAPALEAVASGTIDFAIVARPFEEPDGVAVTHLIDEQLVLFARVLPRDEDRATLRRALLALQWVAMTPADALAQQYWKGAFGEDFPWSETAPPLVVDHLFAVRSLVAKVPGTVAALPFQVFRLNTESVSPFERRLIFPQNNGLYLASRRDGLELRRYQVTAELIRTVASGMKSSGPT